MAVGPPCFLKNQPARRHPVERWRQQASQPANQLTGQPASQAATQPVSGQPANQPGKPKIPRAHPHEVAQTLRKNPKKQKTKDSSKMSVEGGRTHFAAISFLFFCFWFFQMVFAIFYARGLWGSWVWLVGWLGGNLAGWLSASGWLEALLADWLTGCLPGCLTGRLAARPADDRLADWLIGWLVDWTVRLSWKCKMGQCERLRSVLKPGISFVEACRPMMQALQFIAYVIGLWIAVVG